MDPIYTEMLDLIMKLHNKRNKEIVKSSQHNNKDYLLRMNDKIKWERIKELNMMVRGKKFK